MDKLTNSQVLKYKLDNELSKYRIKRRFDSEGETFVIYYYYHKTYWFKPNKFVWETLKFGVGSQRWYKTFDTFDEACLYIYRKVYGNHMDELLGYPELTPIETPTIDELKDIMSNGK